MKIVALVSDAFGGKGGIAKFNIDFLSALCAFDRVTEVVCVPRIVSASYGSLPAKLIYKAEASNSLLNYLIAVLIQPKFYSNTDVVFCGHIHLLPLACWIGFWNRAPIYLLMHGWEVWNATKFYIKPFLRFIKGIITVSEFTKQKFITWSNLRILSYKLPNSVDLDRFQPGPKPAYLVKRLNLENKKVMLTLGRLESSERGWKGFDKVISVLPGLIQKIPEIMYIVAGEGKEHKYLKNQAIQLGVSDHVIFTGYVNEVEKPDFYKLADLYVMPSRAEGFGIVYLEALASGVPVVGSKIDASIEILKNGKWGELVDPDDLKDVERAIIKALNNPIYVPLPEISQFSYPSFEAECHRILEDISKVEARN